ncbi:MAG: hypothetical protein AB9856_00235 [Cellulosilyticaceae bacterium]
MTTMVVLALSLAGCGAEASSSSKTQEIPKQEKNQSEKVSNTQSPISEKKLFGQVSDIVGNDITLSLATFVDKGDEGGGETMIVDENGQMRPANESDKPSEGGEMIMIPMPDGEGDDSEGDSQAGAIEKLPIEYTGETKELTIPAGAKITNLAGKEISFDKIKKGTLLQVTVDESNDIVQKVVVWE